MNLLVVSSSIFSLTQILFTKSITATNDGSSAREASTRPTSPTESVIEIDTENENNSAVDETPEEELGKY